MSARLVLRRCYWQLPGAAVLAGFLTLLNCARAADEFPQKYYVENWHVQNGLPDGEITAIQETPDGYLWVGTPKGLARFDGDRFKVFKAGQGSALSDSRITWLLACRDSALWISTQDGNIVRLRDGKFDDIRLPAGVIPDQKDKVSFGSWLWQRRILREHIIEGGEGTEDEGMFDRRTQLVEDGEGAIWVLASDTVVLRLKGHQWTVFTPTNGLPAGDVQQLSVDHEGHVWVQSDGKLHCYSAGGWDSSQRAVPLGGRWPVLTAAREGGLWVAEPHGSWFLNGGLIRRLFGGQWWDDPKLIPGVPHTPGSMVTCLIEDHAGHIWYGTASGGGVFYSDSDGNWQKLKSQNPCPRGYISCLFEDSRQNIWVGTVGDGLYRISRQPLVMLTLPPSFENVDVNTVSVAHDGPILIGTGGFGLIRYDETNFTMFNEPQFPNLHVCSTFEDSQSNTWIGTSEGLFRLDREGLERVAGPPEMSKWVKALFEDRDGRLWIGTVGALICHYKGQFTVYYLRPDRGYCDIRGIAEDAAGDLWIGTIGQGLFHIPRGQINKLSHVDSFPAKDARSLCCTKDGTLWVGSWGEGLIRGRDGAFTAFTSEDGLPSDRIQAIINDDENRLWLSTDNGVVGITAQVIQRYRRGYSPPLWCQHLSLEDGLANRVCSGSGQPSCARMADGRLLFADDEGVAVLDPHSVRSKLRSPVVFVEAVLADGKALALTPSGEFRVPSSARHFEFDYTVPDLSLPRHLCFRYRLLGIDSDWVAGGTQNVAYYSQLKPGDYRFQVMVGGSDGEWHGPDEGLYLRVVPRLWEVRWIQILTSALAVGFLGAGITWDQRRRLQMRLERLEMQQAVETERRRIARDLHDELGARLTATALHGELALQGGAMAENAKSEMSQMTRRVRQLIGVVDEVVWTADPENDSLSNTVAFLCDYVEQFLEPTGISCRLEISQNVPNLSFATLVRRNLLLAVKEGLNNAVRHAHAGMVHFRIEVEDNWLNVEIADDGQGFEMRGVRAGGKGLHNIKSRMEFVRGRAQIKSEPGKGTTVFLSLPLPTTHRSG